MRPSSPSSARSAPSSDTKSIAERQEVRAHLAGLLHSRAVYDGPFGCRVLHLGREARFAQGKAEKRRTARRVAVVDCRPRHCRPRQRQIVRGAGSCVCRIHFGPRRFTKAVVVAASRPRGRRALCARRHAGNAADRLVDDQVRDERASWHSRAERKAGYEGAGRHR